jgi:hypothetical protein
VTSKDKVQSKPALGVVAGMSLAVLNLAALAYNLYLMASGPDPVRLPLFILHGLGVLFGLLLAYRARRLSAALLGDRQRDTGNSQGRADG